MGERRNPYLILGIDFGAGPDDARAGFAKASRLLRRQADAPYSIEDLNWALYQVEHAPSDPRTTVDHYRVPADHDLFASHDPVGPPPQPLGRTTSKRPELATELRQAAGIAVVKDALAQA